MNAEPREREGIKREMTSYICCEECWENENRLRPATWVYTMDEKKCLENNITPCDCNFLDWTVYICDEHKMTAEEFAEYIDVPEDCDDYYDYFMMEEINQIKVEDKECLATYKASDETAVGYMVDKRVEARC
jgi:hypothetical protein